MRDLALLLTSYLLGSIPFAYLVYWLHSRQDIRMRGNGNVGTRNVIRLLGLRWGLLVLLLDALKGAAAYWLVSAWGADWLLYVAPLAVWLGHCFPLWLRFRGGVGQAAITGYIVALWPIPGAIGVALFLLLRLPPMLFNVSFAIAFVAFLGLTYWRGNDWQGILWLVGLILPLPIKKLIDMPRQKRILDQEAATENGEESAV